MTDPATSGAEPVRRFVDVWDEVPALLLDRHLEVLAASPLARAVHGDVAVGANLARIGVAAAGTMRPSDAVRTFSALAALLRDAIDDSAEDERFVAVIGELVATSRGFATAWAETRAGAQAGEVRLQHMTVGALRLMYLRVPVDVVPGGAIVLARAADPGTSARLSRLRP